MRTKRTQNILSALLLGASACLAGFSAFAAAKTVQSGKTQVLATVGSREITHNELRVEMARMNLSPQAPDAARRALESLIDRIILAEQAREAKLDKQPEALWRMAAAQEQALADLYMAMVMRPVEPTQADVEQFIIDNPTLFLDAKRYTFDVLELSRDDFDVDDMTPLFDTSLDFFNLETYLNDREIPFTLSRSVRPSSSFPEQIRLQLANYTMGDNIVLQGTSETSILKIAKIVNDSKNMTEAGPVARALLRQEDMRARQTKRQSELRAQTKITYHADHIKPTADLSPAGQVTPVEKD